MKILFVSNLFPDANEPIRGLDNANLLHQLRLQEGIEEIRVLALRPVLWPSWVPDRRRFRRREARPEDRALAPRYIEVPYVPKIGSRWNPRLMYHAIKPVFEEVRAEYAFDLVFTAWLYPDGWATTRLAGEMNVPSALVCQGSDAHQYLKHPIRRRYILEACRRSRGVITRSRNLAAVLHREGADEQKLHAIYNGVETGLFRPGSRTEARQALGVDPSRPLLLFVGNLLPIKNPMLLLRAWKRVCEAAPPAQRPILAMIGDGPLKETIRQYARDHGLDLLLPGRQPPDVVAQWMRAGDLLCLSSLNEGLPNVILEAFASGLPVVSTRVGGISEVFQHSWQGELVPPGSEDDFTQALRRQLPLAGKHTLQIAETGAAFSWEKCCENHARFFLAPSDDFSKTPA